MTETQYLHSLAVKLLPEKFGGSMVEYFDGTLRLPYSTRYPVYVAEESPWLIEPLRAVSDPSIRRVDVRGPAGCAKSLIGEMLIAWCVKFESGLLYYVHQSDPDGADAMEDRIYPMIHDNDFLSDLLPADRHKARNSKIVFPHMSLYCVGANMSAAQSKRVKTLIMEEPHMYRPGMMSAFEKRCEGVKNPRIVTLSTGGIVGDESDASFMAGTQEEWLVPCPHCNSFQSMNDDKDRLRFDRTKETVGEDGNQFNWNAIIPTVRYNCETCGMDWPTDEDSRREQSRLGRYEARNPNAPDNHRSFHLGAESVHYFPLHQLLMEKLKASYAAKCGQIEPLKDYIQKRRAQAWDDSPSEEESTHDFERMKGQYLLGDPHEGEITRFLTVDNQAGKASKGEGAHRWYVCRSFAPGESRVIAEGRVKTWEELEDLRIKLGVLPQRTLVDIGFDTVSVQEVLCRYGWYGLWGDTTNKESFPHREMWNGKPVIRHYPFSTVMVGHVNIGKEGPLRQARYFWWCNQPIKNYYHRLKSGLSNYRWTVAQNISTDYQKHTSAEFKRQSITKAGLKKWEWATMKGRDNHLLDCDQMCLVAAMLDPNLRLLMMGPAQEPEQEATQPEPE